MKPQMNTDEHRSVLLTAKFLAAWKEIFPESSWERTPLACMWWPLDRRLHAGSVRSQESGPLRVSVVKSLVAAGLLRGYPCSPRLQWFIWAISKLRSRLCPTRLRVVHQPGFYARMMMQDMELSGNSPLGVVTPFPVH